MTETNSNADDFIYDELQLRNKLAEPRSQDFYSELVRDFNLSNLDKNELGEARIKYSILTQLFILLNKQRVTQNIIDTMLRDILFLHQSSRSKDGFNIRRLVENFSTVSQTSKETTEKPNTLIPFKRKDEYGGGFN